jgi:hypothetical protein
MPLPLIGMSPCVTPLSGLSSSWLLLSLSSCRRLPSAGALPLVTPSWASCLVGYCVASPHTATSHLRVPPPLIAPQPLVMPHSVSLPLGIVPHHHHIHNCPCRDTHGIPNVPSCQNHCYCGIPPLHRFARDCCCLCHLNTSISTPLATEALGACPRRCSP